MSTADLALATRLRCYEVIVQVQAIALIRRLLELSLPSIKYSQLHTADKLALSRNETRLPYHTDRLYNTVHQWYR